jgi:hypothetical protein
MPLEASRGGARVRTFPQLRALGPRLRGDDK